LTGQIGSYTNPTTGFTEISPYPSNMIGRNIQMALKLIF
jgi:hypothetical protein